MIDVKDDGRFLVGMIVIKQDLGGQLYFRFEKCRTDAKTEFQMRVFLKRLEELIKNESQAILEKGLSKVPSVGEAVEGEKYKV